MLNTLKKHPLRVYIVLLIVLRLAIATHTPIYALSHASHDDALQVKQALFLLEGKWLGPYNQLTLVKGITYPFFLAMSFVIGIPINVAATLLYGLSCALFVWVLRNYMQKSWICAVVFSVLFFSPISADVEAYTRVYRFSIVPSFALLVFALMIGTYIRRGKRSAWWWSLWAGLGLGFFWNIREDSIWIMPFVLVCGLFIVIMLCKENLQKDRKILSNGMFVALIPFLMLFVFNNLIKAINYANYDTFVRIELSEGNFPKLVKAIYSVESEEDIRQVTVPNKTLNKLYNSSLAFAELERHFEVNLNGRGWSLSSSNSGGNLDDGHFMWALRDCISAAGYWDSAVEMEEYCARAASEINIALNDGRLPRRKGLTLSSSLVSPWKERYLEELPNRIFFGLNGVASSSFIGTNYLSESTGTIQNIRKMELLTHNYAIYPSSRYFTMAGWIVSLDDQVVVSAAVYDENHQLLTELKKMGSMDVYDYFNSNGKVLQNAKNCRFYVSVNISSLDGIYLVVKANGKEIARQDLFDGASGSSLSSEGFVLYLDSCRIETTEDPAKNNASVATAIMSSIRDVYQKCTSYFALLGLICYSLLTIGLVFDILRRRQLSLLDVWLFSTAIFLSAFIQICGVAYTHVSAFNALNSAYLAGRLSIVS